MTIPQLTEWTVEQRRFLTHTALHRLLDQHDGWDGLVCYLYGGQPRPTSEDPQRRLPYVATPEYFRPFVIEDAKAWHESRSAK